ncbi:MAG: lipid-A-disaccharide synthase [Rhodospirillales bacterium]|nr:lipid-A-disaccharide synthase [Rhodospirillales bacterium]
MPPSHKLGIVAGGGTLPAQIIEACRKSGRDFFVIALKGQAPSGSFADVPHVWLRVGAAGEAIVRLKTAGCKELVMAGAVARPPWWALRPDGWTTGFLARSRARILGDDGLLKALIRTLEDDEGFRVVGADTLVPGLLATKGIYGQVKPDQQARDDIEQGIGAALEIGGRDIGQGAVVQLGEVLAVEDVNGTDAMLKQAGRMRLDGPGGVLVKIRKPGQEQRADLPTIGPATVAAAWRAGVRGIAVEAGGTLVLEREALIEEADRAGLFVIGVDVQKSQRAKSRTIANDRDGKSGPLIFIVAGEPSGDVLGARLMAALKKESCGEVSFAGIGGARMEEQGIKSLFPMTELSVMGATEVIPNIPRILSRIRETATAVDRMRPVALVTIDSPDFSFRVSKRLKGKGIKLIHYVAPSVWAWRPGRARKIAGFLDHLLTLLPFEPPYFEAEGLASTFVGHPVVESGADTGKGGDFRRRHGIKKEETLIAVLPGSRVGEISRLHRIFGDALFLLAKKHGDFRAVVPTVDVVAGMVRDACAQWSVPTLIVQGEREKYDAFAAADVALAASGTVALELAMARTPAVITYRINPITAWIVRRLVKVRFVHLVNIILDREVVPELLQESCRPDFLAAALEDLLLDETRRRRQIEGYAEAIKQLGFGGPSPASRAAKAVLQVIAKADTE